MDKMEHGGLLALYANDLYNGGEISANGMNGGAARGGGGSSGGGSVNLFVNTIEDKGKVTANGGEAVGEVPGGAGGNGTVTIKQLSPDINYSEKTVYINVNENYQIDIEKLNYSNINNEQVTRLMRKNFEYISLDTNIATINSTGKITGIKTGRTKVKIKDRDNGAYTYIFIEVIDGAKMDIQEGAYFTIALKQNGTVWSYGINSSGELRSRRL